MDERGTPHDESRATGDGRHWLSGAVFAVFFLAMALWNTSLLDAGSRLRQRLVELESNLDSLETVQSNQLARERILSAEIARLRTLENDLQGKADAAAVWILRTRVDTLVTRTANWRPATQTPDRDGSVRP